MVRPPRVPPFHERVSTAARWHAPIAILSLDSTIALWSGMGLSLAPDQAAKVNAAAKAAYADILQGQWDPYSVDYSRSPKIVEIFTGAIEREAGSQTRQDVERWVRRVLDAGSRSAGQELFGSFMRLWHQAQANDPELDLPADLLEVVLPAVRKLREPSYTVPSRQDVLSEWDRQLLSGYPGNHDCTDSIDLLLRENEMSAMLNGFRRELPRQKYDLLMGWCANHPYSTWSGNRPKG